MIESQTELQIGLGTLEPEKGGLKPAKVKIVSASVESTPKAKKVSFLVKHPDREEPVKLSSIAYLDGREVRIVGTWLNLDPEGKIQKGSGLYVFLNRLKVANIQETVGLEVETKLDEKYLVFKCY